MKLGVMLLCALSLFAQPKLDKFGGAESLPCPEGPKPHWYTTKIGDKWWFCTPAGNASYVNTVWNVAPNSAEIIAKVGGADSRDRIAYILRRMKDWGFNATDMYTSRYAVPSANGRLRADDALPGILAQSLRPSFYGLNNTGKFIPQPLKAIDTMIWSNAQRSAAWRVQDPFDAHYRQYLLAQLSDSTDNVANHAFTASAEAQKYVIGFALDDTDWLSGFGAGGDFGTSVNGVASPRDNKRHQHYGLLMLYTPPTQGVAVRNPVSTPILYGDPIAATVPCLGAEEAGAKRAPGYRTVPVTTSRRPADTVCGKYALRLFLQTRYGTVSALNNAWGSSYSTFSSSGTAAAKAWVGRTAASEKLTITIPGVSAKRKLSPFSLRVWIAGEYVAADAYSMGNPGAPFNCTSRANPAVGYVFGPSLAGKYSANDCPSTINYETGTFTLVFKTPLAAGLEVRASYVIGGWDAGGTGLMDENGKSAWVPNLNDPSSDTFLLIRTNANIKADLDEFFYRAAYRYFKDMRDALDSLTPGCDRSKPGTCFLYFGPSYLGTWGSPAYAPVVRAAASFLDAYPYYTLPEYLPDYQDRINFIYENFGDKPVISWEAFTGGKDSPFPANSAYQVRLKDQTQGARGEQYQRMQRAMLEMRYPNGSRPAIATRYWDFNGSKGEKMNWGLTTPADDPLDGVCPGPGTGRYELVSGGPVLTSYKICDCGGGMTLGTQYHPALSVGSKVKLTGLPEYTVTEVTPKSFKLDANLTALPAGQTELKVEYIKYPCGNSAGPYGDFLSAVSEANRYWHALLPQ